MTMVYIVREVYNEDYRTGDVPPLRYAGIDKEVAFKHNFNNNTSVIRLELEVWANGELSEIHHRTNIHEWILEYDALAELGSNIKRIEQELEDAKNKYNEKASIIDGTKWVGDKQQ